VSGKLPISALEKIVLSYTGIKDNRVLVGAKVGEDASIIDIGNEKVIVTHVDPITSAIDSIGWLSIHVVANDIVSSGARPRWFLTVLLLPVGTSYDDIIKIMSGINEALKEINGTLVGGHTEFTDSVNRSVIITTAIGEASKNQVRLTGMAQPGDYIIMTKYAALEATALAALDHGDLLVKSGVSSDEINFAKSLIRKISVYKEAMLLSENGLANSMHDPTEGGIIASSFEMAYASRNDVRIYLDKIPVLPLTFKILKIIGADPLTSLSSGSLLATVPKEKANEAIGLLKDNGIECTIIGEVLKGGGKLRIVKKSSEEVIIDDIPQDSYINAIERRKI
jgi:hydrogenase expression/formation protein HypE